ncbi:MAG: AAA family ATPase [Acidimicrobiaceae bacterium]|nr:AAA family ATPase [Acidimicrobiaceae bacterium]
MLKHGTDSRAMVFEDGIWEGTRPNIAIYDDEFVDENVYSGLTVEAKHRKQLHGLILGAQGVKLSKQLQSRISQIEEHNTVLRKLSTRIEEMELHGLSVDEFCELPEQQDIDTQIQEKERLLAAAKNQDNVRDTPLFDLLDLPAFDIDGIDTVLAFELSDLDAAAEAEVRAHIDTLDENGEQWLNDGMLTIQQRNYEGPCPFCAQDISGSVILDHYRAYFSEGYSKMKHKIEECLAVVKNTHNRAAQTAFERSIRVIYKRRQFWSRFCEVPEISINTEEIMHDWNAAREHVLQTLQAKQKSPLEPHALTDEARVALTTYKSHRRSITELTAKLDVANQSMQTIKEQAADDNIESIATELSRLKVAKVRHMPEATRLCEEYIRKNEVKTLTERGRDSVKAQLKECRDTVFPASKQMINGYLRQFGTGFQLEKVASKFLRSGSICTYNVVINESSVAFDKKAIPGKPSFSNTLSSGDRNTLALAFFFAALDQDIALENKIVVIDDPLSSLDKHRSHTTVNMIKKLVKRAEQVFVLSHDKQFLLNVWEQANRSSEFPKPVTIEITRQKTGSMLSPWDIEQDFLTEHDRRHGRLSTYMTEGTGDKNKIAQDIRLHLEKFLRIAHPAEFPPGAMLGPFLSKCRQQANESGEFLDQTTLHELNELVDYANRFHHSADNTPQAMPEINDTELKTFVQRTLAFTSTKIGNMRINL